MSATLVKYSLSAFLVHCDCASASACSLALVALARPTFLASLMFQTLVIFSPSTVPLMLRMPATSSESYPPSTVQIRILPLLSRLYSDCKLVIFCIVLPFCVAIQQYIASAMFMVNHKQHNYRIVLNFFQLIYRAFLY